MTTPTTHYSWGKPIVGSDNNTWGTELNAIFDSQDADLYAVSQVANAALPETGGAMSGRIDGKNATIAAVTASISGTYAIDMSQANYFILTVTGAVTLSIVNVPSTASAACGLIIRFVNAGSNVTWPSNFKWANAAGAPALSASGIDMLAFITDDAGTTFRQVGIQVNVA